MTTYRIVDVCGTLVRDDTTSGFMRWYFDRHNRWRGWLLRLLASRFSPVHAAGIVVDRTARTDWLKRMQLRLLRGESVAQVDASASDYAAWLLDHRRVEAVRRLLDDTRGEGSLVLASAGLQPVVAALAKRLDAAYVANGLACRDGRYLGTYASDLTGRKLEALDHALPAGWRRNAYIAVSDNVTDRALLEGAQQAYVVLRLRRHRRRWQHLQATYLDA